ncbi:hypothetical protein [Actinacidiphila sp. bgisy144]|uniref:hypothetical protein n=1 Tax=Actinacidiphila sp. bgisy144 TaxID=3413791 RepID=UPI003EBB13C1
MSESYDLPGLDPHPHPHPPAEPPAAQQTAPAPSEEPGGAAEASQRVEPLGVAVEATGNADVDAAVERLRDADALPTDAHIEVYEDVHAGLRNALTALDENRG